jgi:hypothetical protein
VTPFVTSSFSFDTAGLIPRKDEPDRRLWLNGFNDVVELRVFAKPPDIPVSLRDAAGLRAYYDAAARTQDATILSLETTALQSLSVIRLLMRAPAKPRGFIYIGSLAVPFKRGSFVLRQQATETMPRDDLAPETDRSYPAHALSRIRHDLERHTSSLRLSPEVSKEPRFDPKPWYAFWGR